MILAAVVALAFIFVASSWWLSCQLRVFQVCCGPLKPSLFSATQSINTLPRSLGGADTLTLDNVATLSLGVPSSMNMVTLFLGAPITYPNLRLPGGGSIEDQKVMSIEQTYVFDLIHNQRN